MRHGEDLLGLPLMVALLAELFMLVGGVLWAIGVTIGG